MRCLKKLFLVFSFYFSVVPVSGQRQLTLKESEELFQKNNLYLLAAHYEIDVAEARVVQAKLWENPFLYTEVNAVNPENNGYFDIGVKGQKVFAVQQLVHLGGKKRNEVRLAKTNTQLAQLEFKDLIRNLKYQLRVSYFSVYYDRITEKSIDRQLENLDSLLNSYTEQAEKGNVPYKDIVRLQSLYLVFQNEKINLRNRILESEKNLSLLLGTSENILPVPSAFELQVCMSPLLISLDSLQNLALNSRPDVLAAEKRIEASDWNLKWQRSLIVPDLTLGANYDQRGGAFNNQINLTLGLPLPLWNRNQGNIKIAEAYSKQYRVLKDQQVMELENEVGQAYKRYKESYKNARIINAQMDQNFEAVYQGVLNNFQKRNISILEFTDFMESYNSSLIQINEIRKALRVSCEEINLLTMQDIF